MSEEVTTTGAPAEAPAAGSDNWDNSQTLETPEEIADAFIGGSDKSEEKAEAEDALEASAEEAEETEVQPEETAEAEIPMPEGMDEKMWNGFSADVRKALNERELAHANALSQERGRVAEAMQNRDSYLAAANQQLQHSLQMMKAITEGEFQGINWDQLSQTDPASYVQLSRSYQQRMQAIQGLQQKINQVIQTYQGQRAQEAQQALENEFQVTEPQIKALYGAYFDGPTFARDAQQYLTNMGVPMQVIGNLTKGYELQLVAKAMLYDRAQAARKAAEQKVADAPKVQAPSDSGHNDETNGAYWRAIAGLRKNPDSIDALASVFASF